MSPQVPDPPPEDLNPPPARVTARQACLRELNREQPDYGRAQVLAILSVQEAVRDLGMVISSQIKDQTLEIVTAMSTMRPY